MDENIYRGIISHIKFGSDFINAALVCKSWYRLILRRLPKGITFKDHLDLILASDLKSKKGWKLCKISENPSFKIPDYIFSNHIAFVCNPNWYWDMIINNKDVYSKLTSNLLYGHYISKNPNITWDIIQANPDILWNYNILSFNPNITWDIVKTNPGLGWDYEVGLCANDSAVLGLLAECVEDDNGGRLVMDYNLVSSSEKVTIDVVRMYPKRPWNYSVLSRNRNITWDIVQANADIPWSYKDLSTNPNRYFDVKHQKTLWDIVQENPKLDWDYKNLSSNPNITWDIVRENPDLDWDYSELSSNPNITWEILQAHLEYGFSIAKFSKNPNLKWYHVVDNPNLNWDFNAISSNAFDVKN